MEIKISEVDVNKKDTGVKKVFLYICAIIGLILVIGGLTTFVAKYKAIKNTAGVKIDADYGWYNLNFKKLKLSELDFENEPNQSLTMHVENSDLRAASLCFETSNIVFKVLVDGEVVYDYHPEMHNFYGKSYGSDIHTITIPMDEGANIMIKAEKLNKSLKSTYFKNVYFEDGASYIHELMDKQMYQFLLMMLVFVVGVALVLIGTFFERNIDRRLEMVSLGSMAMVLSIWIETGSTIFKYLTGNPGLCRGLNHISIALIAVTGTSLVACFTDAKKRWPVGVVAVLTAIDLIINIVAVWVNGKDYSEVLIFTHIVFGIAVILCGYIVVSNKRDVTDAEKSRNILAIVAFAVLVLSGVADLIVHYVMKNGDMSGFTRIGLVIFVAILGYYEINTFFQAAHKAEQAQLLDKMVNEDSLTGLLNRRAFATFEAKVDNSREGACIFVDFNISDMKEINEKYGSATGDAVVVSGADIINRTFGEKGKVYRMGGDEFMAILDGDDVSGKTTAEKINVLLQIYKNCENKFITELNSFNKEGVLPVSIEIPYGMAEYNFATGAPEAAEKEAAFKMNDSKHQIKNMKVRQSQMNS